MEFKIRLFFLFGILLIEISKCTKCLYRLSDPSGETESVYLSGLTDKRMTIIGEHTYKYPVGLPDECTTISKQMVGNDGLWISAFTEDQDSGSCCITQQLECQKYRKSYENAETFVKRVKNSCKRFVGVIRNVYCISDKTTGVSFIQRITLSDKSVTTFLYGCGLVKTVQTPWGQTINLQNKLFIDVENNIIRNTSESSYAIILSVGVIASICLACSLAMLKGIKILHAKYPDNIVVKLLMVLFLPIQLILKIFTSFVLPYIPMELLGLILRFVGFKGIRNLNSIKKNLPSVVRHVATANTNVDVQDILTRDDPSENIPLNSQSEQTSRVDTSSIVVSTSPYNNTTI